ncbi:aminopeptidase B-like [Mizuhopecten yessoensis]|uniref:Aminopeptidase B n=1 Tax=Mizuhopecten yessoensis TaxID=6573 RepID=A0A210PLD4_MIZYE|nr:aminopeptidase B-like [Mizuhopecten yessoensis]OWF37302.1 Aminopeptidase B [Mizuhopecten yessoensis]
MVLHSDSCKDVATVSNFRECVVTHYHLDISVDMEGQRVTGTARLSFAVKQTTRKVNLDIHESLTVEKVEFSPLGANSRTNLEFVSKPFTGYGAELDITLQKELSAPETFDLYITYTASGGPGVCWLSPEQTAGKKKPYMYTQGQAVMNRCFFPCQDTPAVKSPYSANVKVPEGFTPVMSASQRSGKGTVANMSGDKDNYFFSLPHAIPAYLVALAVGDLSSAQIGPRSHVWTEPCLLEKARAEFDGVVEDFLQTGERLFGAYVWDTYDLLVMPPSFPFGGMENPCLTFVTPCLLVGDKSLTDVVIHEISHSWFGNLVTNANWSEFWLNEGFTMYAQRRIMSEIYGAAYTSLETSTGQALLRQHIENTGQDHPLNRLRVIIEPGVDPDDTYNETPYEKGFAFVSYLQQLAGDVKTFDDFLKSYVAKFQFKSLVAEDMFDYYLEYFPEMKKQEVDKRPGFEFIDTWLTKPGWPPYTPDLSAGSDLTTPANSLADQWAEKGEGGSEDVTAWRTYQVLHFLDKLLEKDSLSDTTLSKMAAQYPSISGTDNAEIRMRWSLVTIKHGYTDDFENTRHFLHSQGKQKYTLPVYRALMKSCDAAKKLATDVYAETKDQLHVNVQSYVEKIMSTTSA